MDLQILVIDAINRINLEKKTVLKITDKKTQVKYGELVANPSFKKMKMSLARKS